MWHAPALAVAPCVSGKWKSGDWDDDDDGDGGNPNLEDRVTASEAGDPTGRSLQCQAPA